MSKFMSAGEANGSSRQPLFVSMDLDSHRCYLIRRKQGKAQRSGVMQNRDQGIGMGVGNNKEWVKGIALTALYCPAFLLAWYLSVDQWYLPAGIRAASLFFLPYRYWPYVYAGDAMAYLFLRIPMADKYSEQWAYLSPLLLAPTVSIVPFIFRQILGDLTEKMRWISIVALATAMWSAVSNLLINRMLIGPAYSDALDKFMRWSVGNYVGMLVIVAPLLLVLNKRDQLHSPRQFWRDSALAAAFMIGLVLAVHAEYAKPELRQVLLMLMIAPGVALTIRHGWRGASLGVSIAAIALGLTLPYVGFDVYVGAHDATTFVAQLALTISSTALLVLGVIISDHYGKARQLGIAEGQALKIAQTGFFSSERLMRDRVVAMTQAQSRIDESHKALIQLLKEKGHSAAAMELTRHGAIHAQQFNEYVSAIYPARIEQQGLYDALQSSAFSSIWAGGLPVRYMLSGRPKRLSVDTQLTAYRSACSAIALLGMPSPKHFVIRARVWRFGDTQGIVLSVTSVGAAEVASCSPDAHNSHEFEGRIKANGGILRLRPGVVSFLLPESLSVTDRNT